ncbi:hypothetical protein [Rhabdaerophilum sp.]|uniref:hypothetical protein n=1 Tax=Rhabdaerophilum sp. TaxID=2717341 RepID=UPI0038D45211
MKLPQLGIGRNQVLQARFPGELPLDDHDLPCPARQAFAASLELVRDGRADVRQEAIFAPLFLRRAERPPLPAEPAS